MENALQEKISSLIAEGREIAFAFERDVRKHNFHPFVAADYELVLEELLRLRRPGASLLELGSATGVITIMADLLGFDACGIEIDERLIAIAQRLADKYESKARFAQGSFLPSGYKYESPHGDPRTGTLADGASAFPRLGRALHDFDIVFGYPWEGEAPILRDLMKRCGRHDARLILYGHPSEADSGKPRGVAA